MNAIINNMLVRYTRQGRGRSIVLLHGWGDRLETFDAISSALQIDYEVIRLDLAGFGSSQPPSVPWGLTDYAVQVSDFLKKIDVQPYGIIGHSNGGAIAVIGLASGVLSADKLVLIASAGIRNDDKARKTAWSLIAKAGKVATIALPNATRVKLKSKLYRSSGSDILVSPQMEATFRQIVTEDILEDTKRIRADTLILNGTADTATPPSYAKKFHANIKESKLEFIDNADHFVHQQHSERVTMLIRDFLK